jgi:hypothetical protein
MQASEITNVRYGPIKDDDRGVRGTILFDFKGATHTIAEPQDVLLVGAPDGAAERWIRTNYGFLLQFVDMKGA